AVDLHRRGRDVRALELLQDVRLHVALESRHRPGERGVDVEPVARELLAAHAVLPGEQRNALDHRPPPSGGPSGGEMRLNTAGDPASSRMWWRTRRVHGLASRTRFHASPSGTSGRSNS